MVGADGLEGFDVVRQLPIGDHRHLMRERVVAVQSTAQLAVAHQAELLQSFISEVSLQLPARNHHNGGIDDPGFDEVLDGNHLSPGLTC